MSYAKKCDICGKYFELPNEEWCGFSKPFWSQIHFINSTECEYDLCRACSDELLNWFVSRQGAFEEKNND